MKRKNELLKKAEVSVSTIITVVILIISFIIILIFLNWGWTSYIDKEACHESIVYRSTFNLGFIEAGKRAIPLKCETERICLSMSGKDCKEFGKPNKNNKVVKKSISTKNSKDDILDAFAEALVDCSSMIGEGKLNFMPHEWKKRNYGLICSRIAFDDETKEKIKFVSYGDLFKKLEEKKSNEVSYLEYLYPGWKRSKDSKQLFEFFQNSNDELKNLKFEDWKINLNQERGYAIIAQIAPHETWKSWAAGIGTAVAIPVGIGLFATGIGAPVGAVLIGSVTTIGAASFAGGGAALWYTYPDKYDFSPPGIYPFDAEQLKEEKIYSFEIAP